MMDETGHDNSKRRVVKGTWGVEEVKKKEQEYSSTLYTREEKHTHTHTNKIRWLCIITNSVFSFSLKKKKTPRAETFSFSIKF